ncbi:phosphate regulon sensor histidine kinase PhoR [Paucibacter sp. DJ1R-11]|uniref:phosphate regulon sensor histidine kinase PhoR n=1 Tax=Paucibacter sp. DJ1R-11 TaxID=2893556 RepID=UPI0021E46E54|nr:phosphate regulon sensor histidine kinase PhoR [Paucibacter sp. DJ1R-11]MCV2366027.1 phosphate regulon sensor histidine kinase PhoR [Paucibacter sp. DJ1R-11]
MTVIGFLPRLALVGLIVIAGDLVGRALGTLVGYSQIGEWFGVLAAVVTLLLIDTLRIRRLMQWLREKQPGEAPRGSGYWGDLAYLIERALRKRDRAIAQERLQLQQFLSAIEASPNGVLMLDAHDHMTWCNRMAADHFALDPQRDLQQRITNLVRYPSFVSYLQAGRFNEPLLLASSRGPGTLSVIVRPYGEGLRLVLTQDVTERERAESMRRDFVANVSHEIRTPLTVLSGFIETMSSLPLSEAERRRVLVLMGHQTERMLGLVSDLLTLAQLEGSPRPGADRWLELAPLLKRVEADANALSGGRHRIRVEADMSIQLAGIEAELLSAISNLLSNAVRYTPEGGDIELSWRRLPEGGGQICVQDSGPGIAKEHWPRLTERFYRVDGSRSRDTGGTGLGLSIVKHVMQRHGGELQVFSEVGKGSRFSLLMPPARVRDNAPADGH